jgi:hypothetical protein
LNLNWRTPTAWKLAVAFEGLGGSRGAIYSPERGALACGARGSRRRRPIRIWRGDKAGHRGTLGAEGERPARIRDGIEMRRGESGAVVETAARRAGERPEEGDDRRGPRGGERRRLTRGSRLPAEERRGRAGARKEGRSRPVLGRCWAPAFGQPRRGEKKEEQKRAGPKDEGPKIDFG